MQGCRATLRCTNALGGKNEKENRAVYEFSRSITRPFPYL